MTIDDQIKYEKLQYDVNREAAKISALSSGEFNKYKYLTVEEILPSNKQQIIEQAKFTYSPLGKAFEKQIKTIEDQEEKQIKAIQDNRKQLISNDDYKNKLLISKETEIFKDIYNKRLDKIKELDNKIDYDNLKYVVERSGLEYNFNKIKDPRYNDISLEEAKEKQKYYYSYLNTIRRGNKNASQKRTLANINILFNARDNAIKYIEDYSSMILEAKKLAREQEGTGLKILTSNQMLQRLLIALAQIKAGNNSESLLNEIRQIVYYLYRSKKITKMLYSNIVNLIKAYYKMDTIFISTENGRTPEYHVLLHNLTNKIDLRSEKTVALSNLSIYYTWKNIKSSYNNKFKISAPTWSEEFELPDGSYSIPDIQDYFKYILKKHSESVDNPSIRIYVNKIENRIMFKISTVNKINKDKNGENVPNLEVVEVVLVHCNLVDNDYQQELRILYSFVPNKTFGSLLEISPRNHAFLKTFNSEFREIKLWFTNQKSRPLEVEDKIDVTLIIK